MKAETRAARTAYLFGTGDGVRITNAIKLAEQFGISLATVQTWIPRWEKEFERIAAGAGETGLVLNLSDETLAEHKRHTASLLEMVGDVEKELVMLPKLTKLLEKALTEFVNSEEPKDYKEALALFNAFMRTHATTRAAQSQFVMLKKAWDSASGIIALQDVAVTREKTLATGRAKLQLRDESSENVKELPPALPGSRAGGFIMEAPPEVVLDESDGV